MFKKKKPNIPDYPVPERIMWNEPMLARSSPFEFPKFDDHSNKVSITDQIKVHLALLENNPNQVRFLDNLLTNLTELKIHVPERRLPLLIDALIRNTTIHSVHFEQNINDEHAEIIAKLITNNNTIAELDLSGEPSSGNKISDAFAAPILKALASKKAIININLTNTGMSKESIVSITEKCQLISQAQLTLLNSIKSSNDEFLPDPIANLILLYSQKPLTEQFANLKALSIPEFIKQFAFSPIDEGTEDVLANKIQTKLLWV